MHKPLERFYNYLAKIIDRKVNKMDAKNKKRAAELIEIFPEWDHSRDFSEDIERVNKILGVPPLDAKNPYRFL